MAENPHSVFKTNEDYDRWQPYIDQCDLIEGLSASDKQRAKKAMQTLQRFLGVQFLKRANRERHPLIYLLLQPTNHRRIKIVALAEALEALQGAKNFNRVLGEIKAYPKSGATSHHRRQQIDDQFQSGYSVLQTAYHFLKSGFAVEFLDQRLGSQKKPDIKLVDADTTDELFVEVSALTMSSRVDNSSLASRPVFDLLKGPVAAAGLLMYAEMREGFDQSRVADTLKDIREMIRRAKDTGQLQDLKREYIVVGIAPDNKTEELNQWAASNRVDRDIAGPPVTLNEVERLLRKIGEKVEQLVGKAGILVVPALTSFLFSAYDLKDVISELERQVSITPNLLALIVSEGHFEYPLGPVSLEAVDSQVVVNRMASGLPERIIVIENQSFSLPISLSTRAKIRAVFK